MFELQIWPHRPAQDVVDCVGTEDRRIQAQALETRLSISGLEVCTGFGSATEFSGL